MYHLKPVRPVLFVLVTLSLVWPVPAQTAGGRRIVIKTMIGEVKIRRGTSATWQDARVKMAIKEQDAVRCFVESEAELETDDGSVIKIGENSTLEMTAFSGAKGGATNTSVKILSGNVLSDIKKLTGKQSKFEFETPTASASIRGTRVGFDVSSDQTDIRVYEGTVYVVPAGAREGAEVNANQMTSVAKGQRRVQVQKLQEPETKPEPVKKADSTAVPSDSVKADTAATGRGPGADTSAAADQEAKADTTVQSPAALNLAIMTPEEKAAVKPGEQVTVTGKVSPASATVSVNGKSVTVSSSGDFRTIVMAAQEPGEMDVTVDAAFSGQSKSVTRGITVTMPAAAGPFTFAVTTPSNGQVFAKPVVPVSGTVTPGAEVSVSGIKLTVLSNGTFSGQIPIPDEETDMDLVFEAALGSNTKTEVRTVTYASELRLTITSPAPQQQFLMTMIPVKGEVKPDKAEVTVNGMKLTVMAGGTFSGSVVIPDEEGEVELAFEAATGSAVRSETRVITYRRPADVLRPVLQPGSFPPVSKLPSLPFTVIDRTPDDQITFYHEMDGSRESETGVPNQRFNIVLEPGVHEYAAWAEDKAGNKSPRIAGTVSYLPGATWIIRLRKPAGGSDLVRLPPSAPNAAFAPLYTVEFSVENLPESDPKLLKEVSISNAATAEVQSERNPVDLDFTFDMRVERNRRNVFVIRVRDLNDIERMATVSVDVR